MAIAPAGSNVVTILKIEEHRLHAPAAGAQRMGQVSEPFSRSPASFRAGSVEPRL
jgi:hypothetical protein